MISISMLGVLLMFIYILRVETAWNAMTGTDTSVDYFGVKYILDGGTDALTSTAVAVGGSGSSGRVLESTNGGQSWSTIFSTSLVLTDIAVAYQGGVTHYLLGGINTAGTGVSDLGLAISSDDSFSTHTQQTLESYVFGVAVGMSSDGGTRSTGTADTVRFFACGIDGYTYVMDVASDSTFGSVTTTEVSAANSNQLNGMGAFGINNAIAWARVAYHLYHECGVNVDRCHVWH